MWTASNPSQQKLVCLNQLFCCRSRSGQLFPPAGHHSGHWPLWTSALQFLQSCQNISCKHHQTLLTSSVFCANLITNISVCSALFSECQSALSFMEKVCFHWSAQFFNAATSSSQLFPVSPAYSSNCHLFECCLLLVCVVFFRQSWTLHLFPTLHNVLCFEENGKKHWH